MMSAAPTRYVVIGNGRLGRAMAAGLRASGAEVEGPITRRARIVTPSGAPGTTIVLFCVRDQDIVAATRRPDIPSDAVLGHCSASAAMDYLGDRDRFFAHPLMTFTGREVIDRDQSLFRGLACAYDGRGSRALPAALALIETLGMRGFRMEPERRTLYHAAASMASNFLVTLEGAAERLARECGIERSLLAPLVRVTVENWAASGFSGAITGPIAREERFTPFDQRMALIRTAPDLLPLWDALVDATCAALGLPPRAVAIKESTELSLSLSETPRPRRVVRTIEGVRAAVDHARDEGRAIAFVPTMGALHEGHLSLIRRAARGGAYVVVSVFVNPTQFNDPRDLEAYPRTLDADVDLAEGAGAELTFAPEVAEMYPHGFTASVEVSGVTEPLEGVARGSAHFRGVTTVVSKLFNIVRPDVAYFGQKDAQQALVIRRMVRDLDLPVHIEVCPTVRERDGLAMSSRNARLSPDARKRATALFDCLVEIRTAATTGVRAAGALLEAGHRVLRERGIVPADVEYLAIVDSSSLEPLSHLTTGREALVAIAARVGGVRLIDNMLVTP